MKFTQKGVVATFEDDNEVIITVNSGLDSTVDILDENENVFTIECSNMSEDEIDEYIELLEKAKEELTA